MVKLAEEPAGGNRGRAQIQIKCQLPSNTSASLNSICSTSASPSYLPLLIFPRPDLSGEGASANPGNVARREKGQRGGRREEVDGERVGGALGPERVGMEQERYSREGAGGVDEAPSAVAAAA